MVVLWSIVYSGGHIDRSPRAKKSICLRENELGRIDRDDKGNIENSEIYVQCDEIRLKPFLRSVVLDSFDRAFKIETTI